MSKSKKKPRVQPTSPSGSVETGRGQIKDNYLAAIVTSRLFQMQVVKAKKGKGSFKRQAKHKDLASYLIAA
jgi:alternative ribosome-rescue factor